MRRHSLTLPALLIALALPPVGVASPAFAASAPGTAAKSAPVTVAPTREEELERIHLDLLEANLDAALAEASAVPGRAIAQARAASPWWQAPFATVASLFQAPAPGQRRPSAEDGQTRTADIARP